MPMIDPNTYVASPEELVREAQIELIDKLRTADEDHIRKAMECSYVADLCQGIEPAALLEFYNCVLDQIIGPRGEDD